MVSICSLCSFVLSFSFAFVPQFSIFIDAQAPSYFQPKNEKAQDYDYPSAPISTRWTNDGTTNRSILHGDGYIVRSILLQRKGPYYEPAYACGFYCNGNCENYLFAVVIVTYTIDDLLDPQVVWSANRNNPVNIGATLELTSEGDLVLKDVDGTVAWSTNTSGKSIVGLKLTVLGNLVLFDKNNVTVWQSFDQPTDSLVLGQKLTPGQRLIPSVSWTNWTIDEMITLSLNSDNLAAQLGTSPPLIYYLNGNFPVDASIALAYVQFVNGSLTFFSNSSQKLTLIVLPQSSNAQYMKFGSDGHLRVYQWAYGWKEVADLLTDHVGECGYPMECGQYGICFNGLCGCPASSGQVNYFKQVNDLQPDLGCSETIPLSCEASQYQSFLELKHVKYFAKFAFPTDLQTMDSLSCKKACAKNCSCKAAIFLHGSNPNSGKCYLTTQMFSLTKINDSKISSDYTTFGTIPSDYTTFLKVQNVANDVLKTSVGNQRSNHLRIILGSSLGALFATMILIVVIVLIVWKRDDNETEENYLDQVPGMPTRYKYDDLKAITEDFSKKLGEGGFGSVFEGTLIDGTKVAVKRLDGFGQVKKSFLAEVETVGNIHHVNLVRLMGFCAEKSHRLLIYEYMPNGSLDRWIFHKSNECVLDWQQRKKIILDMAKALHYLHEDCRQKIVHLDIKPQNILLDGNFTAKVADFGLSKLIDRDQSKVVTTMRGTPGYLAPEWLSAAITEKVDVYSFGVVILEIVCGRKIFDRSLDEDDMNLLSLFERKAEEERLLDIVDNYSEDMQLIGPQVVNMMRIAAWCLQGDYTKRPSMSMVIKVLEGAMEVQDDLDFNFFAQPSTNRAAKLGQMDIEFNSNTALLPSVLTGPR
ncbi:G-type lectin S-receptor-like serine/threonine-protein kinase SD2-5 [Eucalyptus grandis]|nr:G-type lectin S-receptor-like serine/threonine-protein kinase SD2-5 [Eucalyptus grandis]